MNKLDLDSVGSIAQYAVEKPEDAGALRLVCRQWNGAVKQWSHFGNAGLRDLEGRIEDRDLVARVRARISLWVPKELPGSFLCRRIFREMSGDVQGRAVAVHDLRANFIPSHLPLQITSVAGLVAVEYESTRVEAEWIAILAELLPHHLAVISGGGTLNEICNRILQQPELSRPEIQAIVTAALNVDDAQVLRAAFASGHITQLAEDYLGEIATDLRNFNCVACCSVLASNPRGTKEAYLFRRIWHCAAAYGDSKTVATLIQIVPSEYFPAYIDQAVVRAAQFDRKGDRLKMLLGSERSDLISPEALGLALHEATLECTKILSESKAFDRISHDDLLRVFYAAERRSCTGTMGLLRASRRAEELPPANFVKDRFYRYMRRVDCKKSNAVWYPYITISVGGGVATDEKPWRWISLAYSLLGLGFLGESLIARNIQRRDSAPNDADLDWKIQRFRDLGL